MSPKNPTMQPFSVEKLPLQGTYFIEASAGTGKTHAIGLLVIRLIVERGLPIDSLLLLTFTNKATYELMDRVEKLLRQANDLLKDSKIQDTEGLCALLNLDDPVERQQQLERVRQALLHLDQAHISTISSFMFEVLRTCTRASGRAFGYTHSMNTRSLVQRALVLAIREYLYDEDTALLKQIHQHIDLEKLTGTFYKHLERGSTYQQCKAQTKASDLFEQLYNHTASLYDQYLEEAHIITPNKVMETLSRLVSAHARPASLMPRFKAIFVDEFQDTDFRQYSVIKGLFDAPDNLLVYIGDPKQNIYTWRDADLNTYFAASAAIDASKRYTMTTNYRSTPSYLEALNTYYADVKLPFNEQEQDKHPIAYVALHAPEANASMPKLLHNGEQVTPIQLMNGAEEAVVQCALHLIRSGFTIGNEPVKPSDIGILAGKNESLRRMKRLLEAEGVPAVLTDKKTIWEEPEAAYLEAWLTAVDQPKKAHIEAALRTPIAGLSEDEALETDRDGLLNNLDNLKQVWAKHGVYPVITKLIQLLRLDQRPEKRSSLALCQQVAERLAEKESGSSLKPADLLRFLEEARSDNRMDSEAETSAFETRRIETDGDAVNLSTFHKAKGLEFPVVLMFTEINKPKCGDFVPYVAQTNLHITPHFCYYGDENNPAKANAVSEQIRETKRMVYVGLTRARYATIWVWKRGNAATYLDNMLHLPEGSPFVAADIWKHALPARTSETVHATSTTRPFPASKPASRGGYKITYSLLALHGAGTAARSAVPEGASAYDRFVFEELPRGQHIGNLLHQVFEFIDFNKPDDWAGKIEKAVLRHLPSRKGDEAFARHLHTLVEHTLNASIRIGGADMRLSALGRQDRIQELAFDYPLNGPLDAYGFNHLFAPDDGRRVNARSGSYEGMMNGVVDMFFRWEGRYYILDWKSNHLGSRPEDYRGETLLAAMNDNNYHLQYLLYTLAADRYLASRLGDAYDYARDFGGVMYLFMRGIRSGSSDGVYTSHVDPSTLDTMKAWVARSAPASISPA